MRIIPRLSRRHLSLLTLAVLLLTGSLAPGANAEAKPPPVQNDCGVGGDAGNTFVTASPRTMPAVNCQGELFPVLDTQDWFQFSVTSGQTITATMNPGGLVETSNFDLCLYDPSGNEVNCSRSGGDGYEGISFAAGASGAWRLAVHLITSQTGAPYTMSVSLAPPDDCGTGVDVGGSHAAATWLDVPETECLASLLPVADAEDWYKFNVTGGHTISAKAQGLQGTVEFCLYDPNGVRIGLCAFTGSLTHTTTTSGDYRIRVRLVNGGAINYLLSASRSILPNDCGNWSDAGGSSATAMAVAIPRYCWGTLTAATDTQDWYQFPATAGHTIGVSLTSNATSNFDICIYNPSGAVVGSCSSGHAGGTDTLFASIPSSGTYRVRVAITAGSGDYTLVVNTGQPNLDCNGNSDAGWDHANASPISRWALNCVAWLSSSTDSDWYQFSATSGEIFEISLGNGPNSSFDICAYSPSGALVAACTTATGGNVETIAFTATTNGNYRIRVFEGTFGSGAYNLTMSVSPWLVKDDDSSRDTYVRLDYTDDAAAKRLNLTSTQVSRSTTATLTIYGQADGCHVSGNRWRLRVNGIGIKDLNPCNEWTTNGYSWKSFSVPTGFLLAGTNTFDLQYLSGNSASRNVSLGVDASRDFGRSDAVINGFSVDGELMWYLSLS